MKSKLLFTLLLLFFNIILAQTNFEEKFIVDDSYVIRPSDAFFGDIDNDGDEDIMTAGGRNVVWFENIDGQGTYGKRKLIANYPIGSYIDSPFLHDIDGDGDLDAIVSASVNDRIIWFENLDGLGNFGPERMVWNFEGSIYLSDIDSDGDVDILSSYTYQNKIVWLKNLNGLGQFGSPTIIDVNAGEVSSLKTADLDGDGDQDILLASYSNDKLIWYENLDGNGTFGPQRIISTLMNDPTSVFAADIDNDGDLDVVSTANMSDLVAWQENLDGNGNFGPLQVIGVNVNGANGLNVADIDNDGDNDIFFASRDDNFIAYYENLNGEGTFAPAKIISSNVDLPTGIKITDIDHDGYLDVMCIASKSAKLSWYKNVDGNGNFGNQNVIYEDIDNVENIFAADLDGDGDLDLISASHNITIFGNSIIAWFENLDGHGNFGKQKGIDYPQGAVFVRAVDVDGDGDLDIIGGTYSTSTKKIIWYENLDGLGNFGPVNDISNNILNKLTSLETADIDGDNDIDILYTTYSDFGWIENTDGLGNYNTVHHLPALADFNSETYPADLDNDGDIDILSLQFNRVGEATWYKNLDGLGNFSEAIIIHRLSRGEVHILNAADMDMDGDLDVVIGSDNRDEFLIWVENTGNGNFGNATVITKLESYPTEITLGDFDNDNDIDVAFTAYNQNRIGWIENIDGQGNFGPEIILSNTSLEANDIIAADLDGDMDIDIIASSHLDNKIIWYKNTFILSMLENSKFSFSIYPNPTKQILNINSATKIIGAEIFNHLGQTLFTEVNLEGIQFLDIQQLDAGIYFIKLRDVEQNSSAKMFLKQK